MKHKVESKQVDRHTLVLSPADIQTAIVVHGRRLAMVPDDATVFFRTPGGGNVSGCSLEPIDFEECVINWTREEKR